MNGIEEAIARCRQVLELRSDDAKVHRMLGNLLNKVGRPHEAVQSYTEAVRLMPGSASTRLLLCSLLWRFQRFDEAVVHWDELTRLRSSSPEAYVGLSESLWAAGRFEQALIPLRRAIQLNLQNPDLHVSLGRKLLALGQYLEGFREFEHRWERPQNRDQMPDIDAPVWSGEALKGKTILVHREWGYGDTIQFARFIPALAQLGGSIVLLVQSGLSRLLKPLEAHAEVVEVLTSRHHFDFQCGIMSLPHRLGISVDNLSYNSPYLLAESELTARWQSRIGQSGFRVGVSWQGNPKSSADSQSRAIALANFRALARLPGVRLISIQVAHGLDQLNSLLEDMPVERLGDDFNAGPNAFVDTAAVMQNLDLVITSDSANAHLAGALARPAWVALRRNSDWRWLCRGGQTPWYPSLRLFRQQHDDSWAEPVAEMVAALRRLT